MVSLGTHQSYASAGVLQASLGVTICTYSENSSSRLATMPGALAAAAGVTMCPLVFV